jgi:alpha-beta hydrolase superfamily lysophospholipase
MVAPFIARDGEILALYEWPLNSESTQTLQLRGGARGVVLIVHGLGEHACRHDRLATMLMDSGFLVRAYDQRGHGQSSGVRGILPSEDALVDDLAEIVDDTREMCRRLPTDRAARRAGSPGVPLILLGHSLGGLVASRFVAQKRRPVEGLVLSSPAFDANFSPSRKALVSVLATLMPRLTVGSRIDARWLSRDPAVVADYRTDRLVHRRVSMRLARFIATAGPETIAAASHWDTPTLLLYAGDDRVVSPAGSRAFADRAAASGQVQPGTLTSHCFDGFYHEVFNEPDSARVFAALSRWLDQRFEGSWLQPSNYQRSEL